jgi:hypothetical protein
MPAPVLLPLAGLWAAALAAPPERYPFEALLDPAACLDCPEATRGGQGALRVSVPLGLRGPFEGAEGSSLSVRSATGEELPFAVVGGSEGAEELWLTARPGPDADSLDLDATALPLGGLRFDLRGALVVARVSVQRLEGGAWVPHGEPALIWTHPIGEQDVVRFPAVRAPLRVRVHWHARGEGEGAAFDALGLGQRASLVRGLRAGGPGAEPILLRLPVVDARLEESGWARYTVSLPQPLPVRSVRLLAEDDVFERGVLLRGEADPGVYQGQEPEATVRRVRVGGAALDSARVAPAGPLPGDELVIYVQSEGMAPLRVPAVEVEVEGLELLLLEPGPGPLRLLGGAPAGTTLPTDLSVARPELARIAVRGVEAGPVGRNPDWVPTEVRAGLAAPAVAVSLRRFTRVHAVTGPEGLVRVPLSAEVLRGATGDLRDLRLLAGEDRQIPYLLRRRAADHRVEGAAVTREEVGRVSRLRVALPEAGVPVGSVGLRTDAALFDRVVTVSRGRATELEPLRVFRWVGADRPSRLDLDVDALVGDALYVEVDNGDNPPLPLGAVDLSWPAWELVAALPAGGARLVYGDARAEAPRYDLGLVAEEVDRRAVAAASLGAGAALAPPSLTRFDRGVLLVGLGALVLGLLGVAAGLLRGVRAAEGAEAGG